MLSNVKEISIGMGEFIVEFDYLGLSSFAIVKKLVDTPAIYYCHVAGLKKNFAILEQYRNGQQLWAEMRTGAITPLSQLMGESIGEIICAKHNSLSPD